MASIPTNSQLLPFMKTLRTLKGKPYERGFSLPGAFYTDPLWTQTECRELFCRDWFCVGRVEEVGQPRDLEGTIWDFYQYLSRSLTATKKSARN